MKVEILHIDDCPNWTAAGELVRSVLGEAGIPEVDVKYRLLSTGEEAAQVPFAGSPTILVDGVDAFPSDGQTSDLACRLYYTGSRFAGLPSRKQLLDVFARR